MRKLHVLILPSWYPTRRAPLNGIFFKEQAEALVEHGLKVGVIYADPRSLREIGVRSLKENHYQITTEVENGVIVYRQAAWNIPMTRAKSWYYSLLTKKLFGMYVQKNGMPDVIHVHSALWAGLAAISLKKKYQIPYIITEHSTAYSRGLLSEYELQIAREVFRRADVSLAVSEPFSQYLRAKLNIDNISIVPNMVDTNYFSCEDRPSSMSYPFTFLAIAFLTPKKGIDVLLRAFALAFKGSREVLLEIGGDGEQRASLERLARTLGIAEQVTFLGGLGRVGVRDAMCRSNVFVLPSYYETFGVVLIEAMSTGTPVIATRSGGPEDIVNEKVGILVDPGNEKQLATAMKKVLTVQYDAKVIRKYTIERYSKESITKEIGEIYQTITRKGNK